jgi:hypothetical protein
MSTRAWLSTLGCLLVCTGSVCRERAHAQAGEIGDADAGHGHFDRGVEYVQDGDLRAAVIEFKRAYIASPNFRVLYNLGQVFNELREYTEAQRYFQSYLTDGGDEIQPARKREVEASLAKLSGRIATLMLSSNVVGAEIFVDDVSVGKTPLNEPLRVSTGSRTISAAISGRPRIAQVIEAAGGDTMVVRLDFAPTAQQSLAPAAYAAPAQSAKSKGPGALVWLGIGTGALAVGAGVTAYLAAHDSASYQDALRRRTTARELDDLDSRATTKALVTDILLGATLAAGVTTLVVALLGNSSREAVPTAADRTRAHLTIGPGTLAMNAAF